jgi:hypothetical protein
LAAVPDPEPKATQIDDNTNTNVKMYLIVNLAAQAFSLGKKINRGTRASQPKTQRQATEKEARN